MDMALHPNFEDDDEEEDEEPPFDDDFIWEDDTPSWGVFFCQFYLWITLVAQQKIFCDTTRKVDRVELVSRMRTATKNLLPSEKVKF